MRYTAENFLMQQKNMRLVLKSMVLWLLQNLAMKERMRISWHLMPCGGEMMGEAKSIFEEIGKVPVICKKEAEGFLVNKLSWACMSAAQEAVKSGLCTVEDIDKAIMYGPGMRMAVTGQLLTISLGCEGGFLALAEKYGKEPTPEDRLYAEGVDEEIANRKPEQGNTVESVCKFRDHMFADILKLHGLL